MKKIIVTLLGLSIAFTAFNQNITPKPEWLDPNIVEINRLPSRATAFAFETADLAKANIPANSKNFLSLNGTWKFQWVAKPSLKAAQAGPASGNRWTKPWLKTAIPPCS